MSDIKECVSCGTPYTPYKITSRYCSPSCGKAFRLAQYKEDGRSKAYTYKSYAKRVYGLTLEDIEVLREDQRDCCAICNIHVTELTDPRKQLFIDHDHSTNIVRGLLCGPCNTMIGMASRS